MFVWMYICLFESYSLRRPLNIEQQNRLAIYPHLCWPKSHIDPGLALPSGALPIRSLLHRKGHFTPRIANLGKCNL